MKIETIVVLMLTAITVATLVWVELKSRKNSKTLAPAASDPPLHPAELPGSAPAGRKGRQRR